MDINDLKSEWQNAGNNFVDEEKLKLMTKINQHPGLKKLRTELFFDAIILTAFLIFYYDGFDGDKKPILINAFLIASILIYIGNNVFGYKLIKNPVRAENILASVERYILVLKRLSITTIIASVLYATTFTLFFTISLPSTPKKYIAIAVMVLIFGSVRYAYYKRWQQKIDHFRQLLNEFNNVD
ncbi:hypothetical protein [Dyadobacter sp. NIV53]|uniref:hypothetical protein n=1 Tax=Dyadobacter sp. NIV53 TaxID=2861765 RepID=UPI001C88BB46|nr:hypothetical protein [Dyadobacter sp. NIV53]